MISKMGKKIKHIINTSKRKSDLCFYIKEEKKTLLILQMNQRKYIAKYNKKLIRRLYL